MDLDDRVLRLEQAVQRLEAELAAGRRPGPTTASAHPTAAWPPPLVDPPAHPADTRWATSDGQATAGRSTPDTETVLKWVGIGLVLLAVGFAVSTAIRRGWIGPEVQLAAALCTSLSITGAGVVVRRTRPAWTRALCTGGTLGTFVVIGSELFSDVADPRTALAATAAAGLGGFVLADRVGSEWVASATVVGSLATWFTIESNSLGPTDPAVATVVADVVIASLLARRHGWSVLLLVTHVVTMIAGLRLAVDAVHEWQQGAVVASAAALALAVVWRPDPLQDPDRPVDPIRQIHGLLVVAVPVWYLGVATAALDIPTGRPIGLPAFVITIASLVLTVAVRKIATAATASLLAGAGITCALGVAITLPMTAALVVVAVQAAVLAVLGVRASDHTLPGDRTALYVETAALGSITAMLAGIGTVSAWLGDPPLIDDLAHLGAAVALTVGTMSTGLRGARRPTAVAASVFSLIWLGSVLVHLPQGQAIVSVSWAAAGIGGIVVGAVRKIPAAGTWGLAVLAVTVGKLLTIDLAEVDALWRAVLFLVIGLGILRIGYLLPRLTGGPRSDD